MASHPPAACCATGFKHEGEATGEYKTIGDTEAYVVHPPAPSTTALLILTDVIGHRFSNLQLLADQFAANGYLVVAPDLFHGDPMKLNGPPGFDFMKWLGGHGTEKVDPVVEKTIAWLKSEMGVKKIGSIGYCFGAKYVCRYLAKGKGIDAGFVAHPSFVTPDELKAITGPLSIAAAETDQIFPEEKRHESEVILKSLSPLPYQINLYSGTTHGFSVKADLSDKQQKYAKEQAFYQAVSWFGEHLAE